MTDIVERLRDQRYGPRPSWTEAADEIERLRNALEKIAETYAASTFAGQQARAALNQQRTKSLTDRR